MKDNRLLKIEELIDKKKIDEAQVELSKLNEEYQKNADYLFLRGKIFYFSKLYYNAIDALLIALEFEKKDNIYNLIAEIYGLLGNNKLQKEILNQNTRLQAITLLKEQMTGIYRKNID